MFTISTQYDEQLFIDYYEQRESPRALVRDALYPGAVAALEAYQEFAAQLSEGGALATPEIVAYHAIATEDVAPYIEQLIQHAQAIILLVQGIDQAAVSAGRAAPFNTIQEAQQQ